MSLIVGDSLTWFQKFCISVLKCGNIPRHIAFIMDGNRRFAKKNYIDIQRGHAKGFDKLADTLHWCLYLGTQEVTVYAFSIENFKRSVEEVNALMDLAKDKLKLIILEKDKFMAEGVCIRVIGNLELIPEGVRKLLADVIIMTTDNKKVFLNIAFAYTSQEEITNSVQTIANGINNGQLVVDDIDENLIDKCLYTNNSLKPDILIRTSGETRFSNFLLWQIHNTSVYFTDVLWPEFCIWHFLSIILKYQRSTKYSIEDINYCKQNDRLSEFLEALEIKRFAQLHEYINYVGAGIVKCKSL